MKNININAVLCDIVSNEDNSNISLGNVTGKKLYITEKNNDRFFSQIGLAVFVAATETKKEEQLQKIDPDFIFSFKEKYEVRIRLTETISGEFKDLGEIILNPVSSHMAEGLCKKSFNYSQYCLYSDVILPSVKEREKFVIKLVIRRVLQDRKQDDGWIVQTIIPLNY